MQQPQWKGSKPQRFSGGRIHLKPDNQLNKNLQPQYSTICTAGIKTFQHEPTKQMIHKPKLKIYPNKYEEVTKQIDLRGKMYIPIPDHGQKNRPQKMHIPGGYETIDEISLRGLKTYDELIKSKKNEYKVQANMQRKVRINGLDPQRNNLPVKTLGDKQYKYPQYSANFYHEGGLIAGSTQKPRVNRGISDKNIGNILTKPNWDVKLQIQQKEQEIKAINSVDDWQQTILKEANPNWNDPDTFFEREEAKKLQKDPKKGGKK